MEGSDLNVKDQDCRPPNEVTEVIETGSLVFIAPDVETERDQARSPTTSDMGHGPVMTHQMTCVGGGQNSSLYAEVWQYVGSAWKEVYNFNNGLEFDCLSKRPEASYWSRLHLPSTSLKALQRLRAALQLPKAIQLDICPGTSRSIVFTSLYEQAVSVLDAMGDNEISRTEIQRILAARAGCPIPTKSEVLPDDENMSVNSEVLVAPTMDTEAVDISVCPLPQCPKDMDPIVAFTRLIDPVSLRHEGQSKTHAVRFVALVLCSARGKFCSAQLGREIGRALAIACMDEEFARVACTGDRPQQLLDYLDGYLSALTLVPTVYMMAASPSGTPTEEKKEKMQSMGQLEQNYMLTDSMVDSIVRRIRKRCRLPPCVDGELKLHYDRHERDKHPWQGRRRYFVEVHERKQSAEAWCVTHRLWQGLRVSKDTHSGVESAPQLPSVSETALEALRQFFKPEAIGLDVAAESVPTMIEAVLHQLTCGGLTRANGADDVAGALETWFEVKQRPSDSKTETSGEFETTQLQETEANEPVSPTLSPKSKQLQPRKGDEACHIVVIVSSAVQQKQGIVGACVRFASPLKAGFTPSGSHAGSLARFLMVLVGPETARSELTSLADAIGALAVDEDLMGDLTLLESGKDCCTAIESWLADLTVVSHKLSKRNSDKIQKQLVTTPTSRDDKVLFTKAHTSDVLRASACSAPTVDEEPPHHKSHKRRPQGKCRQRLRWVVGKLQKYSIPLVTGVTLAMIWENVDSSTYHDFTHTAFWKDAEVFGHGLNLHFLVNDIFMCFFFGLAMKEVAEALLPGGSLNPLSRAINPLFATAGGIFVPIAVYIVCVFILDASGSFEETMCDIPASKDANRRLGGGASATASLGQEHCPLSSIMKGWGVPTATDISLAWMFALLVFGAGHPCINFLLLLAIVDDAIGMIIIAVFYPNPEKPVEPVWLLLVLASIVVGLTLRYFHCHHWQAYIFLAGPLSWLGLIKAHVHPALALVSVVPLMPAKASRIKKSPTERQLTFRWSNFNFNLMRSMSRIRTSRSEHAVETASMIASTFADVSEEQRAKAIAKASELMQSQVHAPLHAFEEALKLPVDLGMFFFGVANAGVQFGSVGGITIAVVAALFAGKTFGIAGFGLFACCLGFPMPQGIGVGDLFAASALGGIGLTVALFVANQAFVDNGLQGQAKMGAVFSVLCAALAFFIQRLFGGTKDDDDIVECTVSQSLEADGTIQDDLPHGSKQLTTWASKGDAEDAGDDEDLIVESLIDDILQTLWTQREYERHGTTMPFDRTKRRSLSKDRNSRNSLMMRPMRGSLRLSSKELDRRSHGENGKSNREGSKSLGTREFLRPSESTSNPSGQKRSSSWGWRGSSKSTNDPGANKSKGAPAEAWGPSRAEGSKAAVGDQHGPVCGRESPTLLTLSEVGQASTPPPPEPQTSHEEDPRMLS